MDNLAANLQVTAIGLDASETARHIESACQQCHRVGNHFRDVMTEPWKRIDQNCATCHHDHQGRDHDLTRVAAQTCVSCHSDLASGCSATPRVRGNITGFDKSSHGDFASLAIDDPGQIKFDHGQHMLPGQVDADSRGGFTLDRLSPQDRARYRLAGQADTDLVSLQCSSCHELAGSMDDGKRLTADSELGRYVQPIAFDRHCAACHSLNPDPATEHSTPLPHAVPWRQIDLLLAANSTGAQSQGLAREPRDDSNSTAVPGEGLGVTANERAVPAGESEASSSQPFDLQSARELVRSKCIQCHVESSLTDDAIDAAGETGKELIPSRWLTRGLYDHAAHMRMDCKYCHQGAYPLTATNELTGVSPTGPAEDHRKVMIAGIDSCTGCHRSELLPTPAALLEPSTKSLIGDQPTWASDQCTLCHRYHTPGEATPHIVTSAPSPTQLSESAP
jgi:hypothetical protein